MCCLAMLDSPLLRRWDHGIIEGNFTGFGIRDDSNSGDDGVCQAEYQGRLLRDKVRLGEEDYLNMKWLKNECQ